MTFLEPDLLFHMPCFETVLCHETVYQPFRSPLCFLEFSNLMSVFNKISSLSSLFWSISSCSSVGSNDHCSLSDLLSLYLAKDTFGIVTNPTTAVGKIVFYLPFQRFIKHFSTSNVVVKSKIPMSSGFSTSFSLFSFFKSFFLFFSLFKNCKLIYSTSYFNNNRSILILVFAYNWSSVIYKIINNSSPLYHITKAEVSIIKFLKFVYSRVSN